MALETEELNNAWTKVQEPLDYDHDKTELTLEWHWRWIAKQTHKFHGELAVRIPTTNLHNKHHYPVKTLIETGPGTSTKSQNGRSNYYDNFWPRKIAIARSRSFRFAVPPPVALWLRPRKWTTVMRTIRTHGGRQIQSCWSVVRIFAWPESLASKFRAPNLAIVFEIDWNRQWKAWNFPLGKYCPVDSQNIAARNGKSIDWISTGRAMIEVWQARWCTEVSVWCSLQCGML